MRTLSIIGLLISGLFFSGCAAGDKAEAEEMEDQPSLLVFSKTDGFRHDSIPAGIEAFEELGDEHGFSIHATEDADEFTNENLQNYDVVVFLNTTEDILNEEQQEVFQEFIRSEKGFVGVHSATDTEYDWEWYGDLIGAYFASHPEVQEADVEILDKDHPSTEHLPDTWSRTDEWYNFKDIKDHIHVLATLDESSYKGGENGDEHPIVWHHEYEGSRIFYTGGGHTSESYSEPEFREHLVGGIRYALGED